MIFLPYHNVPLVFFLKKYCILGFGLHVKNMQDCCRGTYMIMWFAAFLPISYIWHSPHVIPPQPPHFPLSLPYIPPTDPSVCIVLPSLCPCVYLCVLIVQHPPKSENMRCLIFCSWVSLLRMMVSRFIHVPTNDINSSFLMAA